MPTVRLVADVDLGMGATGFEVARKARALNPNLDVIYITGQDTEVAKFGVDGGETFAKPFSPRERASRVLEAKKRT